MHMWILSWVEQEFVDFFIPSEIPYTFKKLAKEDPN